MTVCLKILNRILVVTQVYQFPELFGSVLFLLPTDERTKYFSNWYLTDVVAKNILETIKTFALLP